MHPQRGHFPPTGSTTGGLCSVPEGQRCVHHRNPGQGNQQPPGDCSWGSSRQPPPLHRLAAWPISDPTASSRSPFLLSCVQDLGGVGGWGHRVPSSPEAAAPSSLWVLVWPTAQLLTTTSPFFRPLSPGPMRPWLTFPLSTSPLKGTGGSAGPLSAIVVLCSVLSSPPEWALSAVPGGPVHMPCTQTGALPPAPSNISSFSPNPQALCSLHHSLACLGDGRLGTGSSLAAGVAP